MTLELGDVETTALIPLGSFMLFTALEAGGNYSALLRIIDIGVKKAQAILDLPTMDINGKEGGDFECQQTAKQDADVSVGGTGGGVRITTETTRPPLDIVAQDISFAYDKRKIIDGVSLTIPAGSTTAFVGPSGGGKTTLCHLLSRFWDVDSGSVTLAGKNVRDYDMDSLMVTTP